ncbi:Lrp/AsnC family transcriptional regulator [Candidatus Bathyarchaeota archaeon]|nr:Lrp/AsnC family transcriptional regulator [Candidatus Bathyarchaeota archaeon]
MSKRDRLERRALEIIMNKGEEGILQSELWKELEASSRVGSRISLNLGKKNLITRQRELSDGRWTYRVFVNFRSLDIDSFSDIPCVSCDEILKCEKEGEFSPDTCKIMTKWLHTFTHSELDEENISEISKNDDS